MELSEHVALLAKIRDAIPEKEIALVIYQELNKDRRMKEINTSKANGFKPVEAAGPEMATEKQIAFLKKHAPDELTPNLTKAEAFDIIQGITDKWKKLTD